MWRSKGVRRGWWRTKLDFFIKRKKKFVAVDGMISDTFAGMCFIVRCARRLRWSGREINRGSKSDTRRMGTAK